ncbi:Bro-N domain-containing protein [Megavirus baoshan]|uniref:Bro-N domain-containing protein n=2 Tax=Megavirus TaxID=3044761 RepID=A0A3Q8U8H9_9VIRU|nr:Bro-N domain-containing protein [Megavirus baoshan]YP_010789321.1 Bro-N domain-containing protein [Megavirus baoshan]AZL89720.1 Bro-N domain-containing protein [Megavirus baoshan]UFX99934.1 Bro-N domain-containing protein [Megavirus baoshan]
MPKINNNKIIKLYETKDDERKRKKRIKKITLDSDSDTDSEIEIKSKPKAIVKKIVGDGTKVVTQNDKTGIISKMFTYEEADVLVIKDKNGDYWYKGKNICDILEYSNSRDTLKKNVDSEYKKSFADMGVSGNDPLKIDPQTTFIDDSGLFQLVSRSKKSEAIKLWRKITKEILPELFYTGHYTLPAKTTDIERLTKSFYDDNMLSSYDKQPVVYLSYVGEHKVTINGVEKTEHVIKFGETRKMSQRDLNEHRNFYKIFNVLGIWKSLANVEVESQIKNNFKSRGMLVDLVIKGKNKTKEQNKKEHIVLNEVSGLDYCLNMIEDVVNNTTLPQENEYQNKINKLECKNEILNIRYENSLDKYKLLEKSYQNLEETNKLLKEKLNKRYS